jgi:hypothetical protein
MRLVLLLGLWVVATAAFACGICIDDKIASCYDHSVVESAKTRGHAVAFFALEGDIVKSAGTKRAVARAIDAVRGMRKGSARVSLENGALSFAYDPARTSPDEAGRAIGAALAPQRLRVKLLRIIG